MTARILILTAAEDAAAGRVAALLTDRGAEVLLFDPGTVPTGAQVEMTAGGTGPVRRWLRLGGRDVDLDGLTCVWHRRPSAPVPPQDADVGSYLDGVWRGLVCRQVPAARDVTDRAGRRSYHLAVAAGLGFPVPPTLFTADPRRLRDFRAAHDGRVVTRPLGHGDGLTLARAEVAAHAAIRVLVVGDAVFAVEAGPPRAHRLPDEVAGRCRELVGVLGLSLGAVELVLSADGRYVFVEVDPHGRFDGLELDTGPPVTAAVAELLHTGVVPA